MGEKPGAQNLGTVPKKKESSSTEKKNYHNYQSSVGPGNTC